MPLPASMVALHENRIPCSGLGGTGMLLVVDASWELDIWGRIRRSNEAARADLLSKEENRRAVVLQLVSGVAESYFNLLQFDDQLDIAKRTLHSWEESVRIAQARLKQLGIESVLLPPKGAK